jgi:hypothetical protein
MLRFPHFLENRLTDGGKIVSRTHLPRSALEKYYFSSSGAHFCYRLSKPQGLVRPEGLGKLNKFIHLIGSDQRTYEKTLGQIFVKRVLGMKEMDESSSGRVRGEFQALGLVLKIVIAVDLSFDHVASRWRCRNE